MTTTPTHGKNDTRLDDLDKQIEELGVQAGQGKDTLVKFGILMVNAAYDGVVDLQKDKHGPGRDDAVIRYEKYSKASSGAVVFNPKGDSGKVQATKLRTCIKLGSWTRGGKGEPIATVNKLMSKFLDMRKDPTMRSKLDDAYNVLLRYARFQLKQNSVVNDDELLRQLCLKAPAASKTVEEVLQGLVKQIDDLRMGKTQNKTLQHSSAAMAHVTGILRQEIADLRKVEKE